MTTDVLIKKIETLVKDKTIGKLQRLARERFLKDLKRTKTDKNLKFDIKKAERVVKFIQMLHYTKGAKAGQRIELQEWQIYDIIYPLFGFYKKNNNGDWVRRYKIAYNEIARKNGKSELAAGIGLYLAFGDGELGAEVYTVATKRDQAKIVWEASEFMKNNSPLKKYVKTAYSKMIMDTTNSKYEPLGADSKTLDGLNVHGAVIDEYHAHKTSELYDVIRSGMGARKQPLMFIITTAGFDKKAPCYTEREYARKILEGVVENDEYFAFIATIDDEDIEKENYYTENIWIKANPNMGVSLYLDDFKAMAREAKEVPTKLNNFLTKRLNVWTDSITRWISTDKWNKSFRYEIDEERLKGKVCFGGLDLSSTTDISALVWLFKQENNEDEWIDVLCRFWIPEDNMRERVRRDKVPYDVWVKQGWIKTTPGDVIDYDFIEAEIKRDFEKFKVRELAYDRWNATSIINNLMNEGIENLVPFGQGFASMSAPTKELEMLVLKGKFNHGNNPVLKWMMSNVAIRKDPAGNIKIDKAKSSEKVDGMVAAVMALGRMIVNEDNDTSIYETRGIRTL